MAFKKLVSVCLALAVIPACAANTGPGDSKDYEEPSFQSGKADGLNADNWTYFSVRPDYRKCMWPMCGGYWVSRVNQPKTKCPSGGWQNECYVSEIDWSAVGLSEAEASDANAAASGGLVVLRGELTLDKKAKFDVAVFEASEGWLAATDAEPSGIFYRAHESGIVCVTFPCPTVEGTRLNRNKKPVATYAGLDLSGSGASEDQLNDAWGEMREDGLVVAADVVSVTGPAGQADALSASQFYTRIRHSVGCHTTGCSGQICAPADQDILTTCEYKPEYGCYKQFGTCEEQADGTCGWTKTDELGACLANP